MYSALLHQDSMTYSRMQMYCDLQSRMAPHQLILNAHSPTTPEQNDLLQNALLHSTHSYPLLIEAHLYRALQHQDSMTLENGDVPTANDTPPPTPSVQSPTTPGQYDIAECRCTHCQCTPQNPLMESSVYRDVLQ